MDSRQLRGHFGFDAGGLGAVDGDGAIDFLLTSAWSEVHGAKTGCPFVLSGARAHPEPVGTSEDDR